MSSKKKSEPKVEVRAPRAKRGPRPTHECSNCKCTRYKPCTCIKGKKGKPNEKVLDS